MSIFSLKRDSNAWLCMAMNTHVMEMKLIQLTVSKILPFNFAMLKSTSVLVRGCGRWN